VVLFACCSVPPKKNTRPPFFSFSLRLSMAPCSPFCFSLPHTPHHGFFSSLKLKEGASPFSSSPWRPRCFSGPPPPACNDLKDAVSLCKNRPGAQRPGSAHCTHGPAPIPSLLIEENLSFPPAHQEQFFPSRHTFGIRFRSPPLLSCCCCSLPFSFSLPFGCGGKETWMMAGRRVF